MTVRFEKILTKITKKYQRILTKSKLTDKQRQHWMTKQTTMRALDVKSWRVGGGVSWQAVVGKKDFY